MWTGTINFGLVNIPVELHSGEAADELDFDMLDKRDFSPVKYRRVNAKSGRDVPWSDIIKGYQYQKGEYVALSDEDFKSANVEATRSIDIVEFVDRSEISPIYFDNPYYLLPLKNGQRAYALLRDVMKKNEKVGIAKIVIRTRQHLGALLVEAGVLVLNLLRFPEELRDASKFDSAKRPAGNSSVSSRELKLAEQLVESMVAHWHPQKYRDEYRDDLVKLIQRKIKSGQTKTIAPAKPARPAASGKVIDIMHLLRRSMDQVRKKSEPQPGRKAS